MLVTLLDFPNPLTPMLLSDLGRASRQVAATRSRLKKRALLSELLKGASAGDVRLAVSYLSGVLPQGRIGLGPAIVRDAFDALGDTPRDETDETLDLASMDSSFDEIAGVEGKGSKDRRLTLLTALLARCAPDDQGFIAGLVLGELRQGALEAVLLESVADAAGLDDAPVRRAAMLTADPARVAAVAFEEGLDGLARFRLETLSPIRPMLAQPAETMHSALESIADAAIEYKLDGARVQIHREGNDVCVFTRQLNDVTASVPEIVEAAKALPARSLVLDGEAITLRDDGRPNPFQVTMRRFGRKTSDDAIRRKLPLSVFLFDCLLIDGDELIDKTYRDRYAALADLAPDALRAPRIETVDPTEASRFLARALAEGHEGVMVKALDSLYAAGNRGADWLKVKHAHTLDLVVLAAEWGSGRRKGWLSNLHLGAKDGDDFVMLGKTFKGLTDKLLKWQTEALLARETHRDDYTVYVRPELVVEIAVNEIQASPQYPAGMALRFARVKRYRDDKPAAEADTISAVQTLFEQQNPPEHRP